MLTLAAPPVSENESGASWFRRASLGPEARRETASINWRVADMSSGVPVSLYLPAPNQKAQAYSIFLNALQRSASTAEVLASYSNVVALTFPGMEPKCTAHLQEYGFSVRKEELPFSYPGKAFAIVNPYGAVPELDYITIWLTLGQLLLLPFKSFDTMTAYTTFLRSAVDKLAASIRINLEDFDLALDYRVSNLIRSAFGFARDVKMGLLDHILGVASSRPDSVQGRICNCVAKMLQHAEMECITLISSTIVDTKSPIIRDSAVAMEVVELAAGIEAVENFPEKEYFGIRADPFQSRLIESDRFRTLYSVAVDLNSHPESSATSNGDSSALISRSSEVARLAQLHRTAMASCPPDTALASQPDPTTLTRAIEFLTRSSAKSVFDSLPRKRMYNELQ